MYEAYGGVVLSTGSSENNRLANTKERDFSIGLDNHGFRYFDPEVGRYISRDPIGYSDGLNNYLHANNNPINRIDPHGLFNVWGGVIGAAVGGFFGGVTAAITGGSVWKGIGMGMLGGGLIGLTGNPKAGAWAFAGMITKEAAIGIGAGVLSMGLKFYDDVTNLGRLAKYSHVALEGEKQIAIEASKTIESLEELDPKDRHGSGYDRIKDIFEKVPVNVLDLPKDSTLLGGYFGNQMYLDKKDIEKGALPLSQVVFGEWQHSSIGGRQALVDRTASLYDEYYRFTQDMVSRYGKAVDVEQFLNCTHFDQKRRGEFMKWYEKQQQVTAVEGEPKEKNPKKKGE